MWFVFCWLWTFFLGLILTLKLKLMYDQLGSSDIILGKRLKLPVLVDYNRLNIY